jgi:PAS domain S-box-containing protein
MGTRPDPDPDPGPTPGEEGDEAARRAMADALAAIVYGAAGDREHDPELEFANRYALEFFGVRQEDIAGPRWIDLVHPDDRDSVRTAWHGSLATGQHYRHEHRLRMADGVYRRFLAQALPLRDEGGAIVKWCGVLTPLEGPRRRGPSGRPAKVDYYPLRDEATGQLRLVAVAAWDVRPADPAAKLHPSGMWYRVSFVEDED